MQQESSQNKEYKYFSNADLDRINENYMMPVFEKILSEYSFQKVLDYGCGNGIFGITFKQKDNYLCGVDASSYALKDALKRGYDKTEQVTDFCSDTIPFKDKSFDFILCKDILEHLLDPEQVLKECQRLLTKNGLLLVHVPNHFPLIDRIRFLFSSNLDTQNYFPDAEEWNFPHIRFYTYLGLHRFLKNQGFQVVRSFSDYFARFIPGFGRLPLGKLIIKKLAQQNPNNFSAGFTLLVKKI